MAAQPTDEVRRSVLKAMFLMVALSLLVFWLPIIGPLIAGFVGGRVLIRRPKLALVTAVLPSVFVGLLALFGWYYIPYPLAGLLSGGDFTRAILFDSVPLMAGALLGAALP